MLNVSVLENTYLTTVDQDVDSSSKNSFNTSILSNPSWSLGARPKHSPLVPSLDHVDGYEAEMHLLTQLSKHHKPTLTKLRANTKPKAAKSPKPSLKR